MLQLMCPGCTSPGAYPPPDDFDYNSGVYMADHRSTRRDAHHALTTVGAAVFIMVRSSDLVRGYASPPFRPAMIMWESWCLFTRGSGARIVDIAYGLKSNSANFVTKGLNHSHDPLNVDVVEESIPSSSIGLFMRAHGRTCAGL
jgi:hypothetical protein